ncbi:HAD family hydrolase [Neobacillus jeddahensis]|uniref:HAD family hydrolase n=1 Tax=Neobacillus jeddahensis TaxID=1461580 RepID=UPI00059142E6|nr:HAD family hydrolase [Neobacillus jeddahensis]
MIFASDLDRTLMYSARAITDLGMPISSKLKPVEEKDGKWVSFMTETSFIKLKEISHQGIFVPVTTRTTAQFNRFVIFKQEIPIKYAVTSNGATILYQGIPLKEWSNYIQERRQMETVSQIELLNVLKKEGFDLDGEKNQAENLFFYYILNCLPTVTEKEAIDELALKNGWRVSLQGRKLYFIPKAISKGSALEYICKLEGINAIAGAGDSILDWDFLKNCQYRFVPNHGELANLLAPVPGTTNYFLTKSSGLLAGEEILQQFHNLLS